MKPLRGVSVPGHALRCGPETSVTSPLRWRRFELRGYERHLSSRRGCGNVEIPKGFPKSVGRVGSRLHGFPYSVHFRGLRFGWINRYAAILFRVISFSLASLPICVCRQCTSFPKETSIQTFRSAQKKYSAESVVPHLSQLFALGVYMPTTVSPCSMAFPAQFAALLYKTDTFSQACLWGCR